MNKPEWILLLILIIIIGLIAASFILFPCDPSLHDCYNISAL